MTTTTKAHFDLKTLSLPALLLRLEGLAFLITALVLYAHVRGNWLMFALLLLSPDLAMVGYLATPRLGAITYNAVHTYAFPLALAGIALAAGLPGLLEIALIVLAHIGMDRTVGYGLKYPTHFKDTHLGRV